MPETAVQCLEVQETSYEQFHKGHMQSQRKRLLSNNMDAVDRRWCLSPAPLIDCLILHRSQLKSNTTRVLPISDFAVGIIVRDNEAPCTFRYCSDNPRGATAATARSVSQWPASDQWFRIRGNSRDDQRWPCHAQCKLFILLHIRVVRWGDINSFPVVSWQECGNFRVCKL